MRISDWSSDVCSSDLDDNIPQYGVPYYDGLIPGVHRSDYFGYRNVDRQEITVDQATTIFEHDFSDSWSIRKLARWQKVNQLTVVGPPQGTSNSRRVGWGKRVLGQLDYGS